MGRLLILLALLALSCPAWARSWDNEPPQPPPCIWINQYHCVAPEPGHCVQINRWHCVFPATERRQR